MFRETVQSKGGDKEGGKITQNVQEGDGMTFLTGTTKQVNTLRPRGDNRDDFPLPKLIFGNNERGSEIECECLLVGVANVENLGLDEAGVIYELGKGIVVNDLLQSISNKDVFGVGMSDEMAKVVVQNSLFDDDWKLSSLVVPGVACDCLPLCRRCCLQGFHSRR
jgi:hypothetical protein